MAKASEASCKKRGKKYVHIKGQASFCASKRRKRKSKNKGNMAGLRKACAKVKRMGFTGKRKNLKAACAAI